MRKSSAKILAIILALFMAASLLAGCANNNSNKQSASSGQQQVSTGEQTSVPKEKIKVSWTGPTYGPIDKDSYVIKELEKAFPDVEFDLWPLESATYNDQLNTRIAGGDIPDIMWRSGRSEAVQYVQQGVLGEVPYDIIKQNAPEYYETTKTYGKDIWAMTNVDGKNYGLPNMLADGAILVYTMGWRKDWLDNVGIAKVPETLDEFEEVFKRFTNDDPDKNGKKDTYGLTAPVKDWPEGVAMGVFGAYGIFPFQWCLQPDGTVKMGIVTPQARDVFTILNRWYKLGYLDPEFITVDWATSVKIWTEGKVGGQENTYYYLMPGQQNYDDLVKNNSNAKVVFSTAPKGPGGRYGYYIYGKSWGGYCFSKNLAANLEKTQRVLQVMNKMMSDKDLAYTINNGKEGVHWKRDEAGAVVAIPPYNDPKNIGSIGNAIFYGSFALPEIQNTTYRSDTMDIINKYCTTNVVDGKDYFLFINNFTNPDLSMQSQNARKVALKGMVQFITGERPLDQFDKFVKEWEAAGGAEITQDANKAYQTGKAQIDAIASQIN